MVAIADDGTRPCWTGDIDITSLKSLLQNGWPEMETEELIRGISSPHIANQFLLTWRGLEFLPLNVRDASPPFPRDVTPTAVAIVDLCQVPSWMFADMSWSLYTLLCIKRANGSSTSSAETNKFFQGLIQSWPLLPDNTFANALLLTTPETNTLIITTLDSTTNIASLHARSLHPPTLLIPSLTIKHESPEPSLPNANTSIPAPTDRQTSPDPPFAGQFLAIVSPARISAREASCSQFSAKLESPHRKDAKARQERRVRSLLHADITRRRKQETFFVKREGSVFSARSREDSVMRDGSVAPSSSASSMIVAGALEAQTKEVVKQTVMAALRLHSISSADADYKGLVGQCVNGAMFALRVKLRAGKSVGIGEIGSVVEGLLDIFLTKCQ